MHETAFSILLLSDFPREVLPQNGRRHCGFHAKLNHKLLFFSLILHENLICNNSYLYTNQKILYRMTSFFVRRIRWYAPGEIRWWLQPDMNRRRYLCITMTAALPLSFYNSIVGGVRSADDARLVAHTPLHDSDVEALHPAVQWLQYYIWKA